ncbi:ABC transporter ATP-binding protein [Thermus thermophilus]|uniref:ABC transporter ATP-binding protein n=1 Tax=Thermus thermophilus TaxID=274 RepID=A0AAD1NXF2_THETH|nr:ABC transporter ATP-binding protein [Thermus thermophilus]BBL81694.1 ABC transporter ATP-binding protein [Thermus thermophilus]BBL83996.1 ABC transporter ATP-binding protein [Thermus thermophilus]BCZ86301.1 ABC transporter ATP-binding protein [Thermus thermophilus]BCZ88695.1 ABC transporter ATP-binding protein [Thermus thermophilus]BCZ91324.1 ABC transporter ATP-binding protein [Thermus thermophilus]
MDALNPIRPEDLGPTLLLVNNIEVVYHDVIQVLRGVSLKVPEGRITALLGPNGAGKTTTLRAISGLLIPEDGEVVRGEILFRGAPIQGRPPEEIVKLGIVQVLEGRRVFKHLTVEENLKVGTLTRRGVNLKEELDRIYHYFPRLAELRHRLAGYCSGGEQQMIAIGRALLAKPRLLLLDEPSLGLAPLLVREIFDIVARVNAEEGVTVLVVEQNARVALSIAHYGYIMESGRIVLEGDRAYLLENPDVQEFYLGVAKEGGRKSFKEVKAYKRRKRFM